MEEQSQTTQAPAPVSEKKSNKKIVFILLGITILVIVLVAGGYFLLNNLNGSESDPGEPGLAAEEAEISTEPTRTPSSEVNFTCAEDKAIEVAFYDEGDYPAADLVLNDGEITTTITLYKVESGSGAKYANTDESMVFWNQGNESFVEEAGEKTYVNCKENS